MPTPTTRSRAVALMGAKTFTSTGAGEGFSLAEYSEKWAYLRHIETLRVTLSQWFVVVVGGLLAFTLREDVPLDDPGRRVDRLIILLFLIVYTLGLTLLVRAQKHYHNEYRKHILAIERDHLGTNRPIHYIKISPFRIFEFLITLIGAGISVVLGFVWIDKSRCWVVVSFVLYWVLVFILQRLVPIREVGGPTG